MSNRNRVHGVCDLKNSTGVVEEDVDCIYSINTTNTL